MMAGTSATVYKAASRLMKISSCVFSGDFLLGQQGVKKLPKVQRSIWHHHYLYHRLLAPHVSGIAPSVSINLTFPSQHPSFFNTKIKVPTKIYFKSFIPTKRRSTLPNTMGDVDFSCVCQKNSDFSPQTADQQPRPSNEAMAKIEIFQKRAETLRLQPPEHPHENMGGILPMKSLISLVGAVRIHHIIWVFP